MRHRGLPSGVRFFMSLAALCVALTGMLAVVNPNVHKADAAAGINEQMNYQARLLDSTGAVVPDGTYNIRFRIYQDGAGCEAGGTSPCGGTLKWTEARETTNRVTVRNGYFSVQLGSVVPFSTLVDWGQNTLWLSVDIGGTGTTATYDGEMLPFRRLSSVPYAFNAKQLGGLDYTKFLQLAPAAVQADSSTLSSLFINKTGASGNILELQKNGVDVTSISNTGAVLFKNSADSTGAFQVQSSGSTTPVLSVDTQNGRVGIGTNTPGAKLQISGDLMLDGMSAPAVSGAGQGRIYFDSTANVFKVSQNGAAYTNLVGGSGGSTTLQNAYDNSGTPATILTSSTTKGILFKSGAGFNAASAFDIQDASGNSAFTVNTTTDAVSVSTLNALTTGAAIGPITQTQRVSETSVENIGTVSYTTSTTFTPAANTVLVATVTAGQNCTAASYNSDASALTLSGGSLTWVPITGIQASASCDSAQRSFYAVVGSSPPSNMSLVIGAGGVDTYVYEVSATEFTNVDTTTPVYGSATGLRNSNNNDTWTLTLPSTPGANDVKYGTAGLAFQNPGTATASSGFTTPSGWTQLSSTITAPISGPSSAAFVRTQAATNVDFSLGTIRSATMATTYLGFILKQTTTGGVSNQLTVGASNTSNVQFGTSTLNVDITNGLVRVGSATIDATAILFQLDQSSSASDPTEIDGGMYYNTSSQSFRCGQNGRWRSCVSGVLFANTTVPAAVANTVTETTFAQSYTIPANDCQPGRLYRITAQGSYSTTASPTMTFRLKLGSTNIAATNAIVMGTTQTNRGWRVEGQFVCITTGSSGTIESQGAATVGLTAITIGGGDMVTTTRPTINTTTTQAVQLSVQWGTASASNTITLRQLIVEMSGP